jgi:exodeoxyribonuclease V alpha subunit
MSRVPETVASLAPWARVGVFGNAELRGAAVLVRADPSASDGVHLAAALALWAPLHGHACIDLARVGEIVDGALVVEEEMSEPVSPSADREVDEPDRSELPWPALDEWSAALRHTSICRTVSCADDEPVLDERPLVLHGTLLYTQRQWVDECTVAKDLRSRAAAADSVVTEATLAVLKQMLPVTRDGSANLQHDAALMALRSRFAVIVGGPGTGKTHTIARLLAVVLDQAHREGRTARVALAAPTGKAAARMAEAIGAAVTGFDSAGADTIAPQIVAQLTALRPTTIHRLLGSRGQRTRFVNGMDHPLDDDIVIIDEASMVALPMMARLVEALRPGATLVLVGDPDQLESIEVGSVLADIVSASAEPLSPLATRVARLDRSRRQAADSPIGPLSDAIRLGQADDVLALLGAQSDLITFVDTEATGSEAVRTAVRNIVVPPLEAAAAAARAGHAADALGQFADVRVLCAHRRGPYGVDTWNRLIESWLLADSPSARPPRYYPGRPLLVTRNDQRQRIANGDTGIIVAGDDGLRAAFATADGLRLLAPAQLDTVDTAFAMTIHKSQGSEYATVVVILPPADSALIGRELLYTAITRSTRRLIVVGSRAALVAAVHTPGQRVTGLAAALSSTIN